MERAEALALAGMPSQDLAEEACRLRETGHGRLVTFSPKVFVPLTKLCRDVCHYCTFARPPRRGERAYMSEEEVLEVARAGAAVGCHEALFTLGDKPELRYRASRLELRELGCATTLEYLARCAALVLEETGLLPHLNPGVMSEEDVRALREVSVSQGLMVESLSERLCGRGGPHFGSPDKLPARRLETLEAAGRARAPFTTGILIGIGETRAERIEALLAIRELGERHGHVQEVIVQNFRAKPGTRMASAPEPSLEELLWTCAAARLVLGSEWSIQAPPNLSYDGFPRLLEAGIDDWGGISPVTLDHVNPEAPWPALERARARPRRRAPRRRCAPAGGERRHGHLRRHAERQLHERLLLPLRLLRLLEGSSRRRPARPPLPRAAGRDHPPRTRGVGARCDRDLPPGRDPPGLHGRLLPRRLPRPQGSRPRPPRPRLLGARGLAGRGDAAPRARRLPRAPARGRPRLAPRHRGRDPRRRGAGRDLPGQGDDGAVARGARDRPSRRPALHRHDHVRPRRLAAELGPPPAAPPPAAARERRLHRARAAPVRAHGGADLPEGPRPPGPDLPRGAARARGRPPRAP